MPQNTATDFYYNVLLKINFLKNKFKSNYQKCITDQEQCLSLLKEKLNVKNERHKNTKTKVVKKKVLTITNWHNWKI